MIPLATEKQKSRWQMSSQPEKAEPSARRKANSSTKCDLISQALRGSAIPGASESRSSRKTGSQGFLRICSGSSLCSPSPLLSCHLSSFTQVEGWKVERAFSKRGRRRLVVKGSLILGYLKQWPLYFCLIIIHDLVGLNLDRTGLGMPNTFHPCGIKEGWLV